MQSSTYLSFTVHCLETKDSEILGDGKALIQKEFGFLNHGIEGQLNTIT